MGMPSEPHLEGGPGSKICRKSALHFAGISPDMIVCRFHMFSPIVWRFLPPTRLIHSNSIDAFPFDNECLQLPFLRSFFGSHVCDLGALNIRHGCAHGAVNCKN